MSKRSPRRIAVALALAVLLAGATSIALVITAPARAASSVESGTTGAVSVTAVAGFAFTPNAVENVPTGTNISVTFTDNDAVDHTFTIIGKQGWVIPSSYSSDQIDALAFGSTPSALLKPLNATSVGTSGEQVTATFTSPAAKGWYEFVCTEPGHFQNGMYGFIAFGESLPGNLTVASPNTDPGPAVFIIVGTIVALVVIALVLGFVVGRRRGATYEMPPERLGYPEPEAPGAPSSVPPLDEHPKG
jgi:plastocyanin